MQARSVYHSRNVLIRIRDYYELPASSSQMSESSCTLQSNALPESTDGLGGRGRSVNAGSASFEYDSGGQKTDKYNINDEPGTAPTRDPGSMIE